MGAAGSGGRCFPPGPRMAEVGGLLPSPPAPRGPRAARVKREPRPLAAGMLWPRSQSAALGVCALLAPSPGATVTGSGSAGGAAGGRGCALKSLCPRQRSAAGSHRERSGGERREPPLCRRARPTREPAGSGAASRAAGGAAGTATPRLSPGWGSLQRYPAGVRQRSAAGRRALAPWPCRSGLREDRVSAWSPAAWLPSGREGGSLSSPFEGSSVCLPLAAEQAVRRVGSSPGGLSLARSEGTL